MILMTCHLNYLYSSVVVFCFCFFYTFPKYLYLRLKNKIKEIAAPEKDKCVGKEKVISVKHE